MVYGMGVWVDIWMECVGENIWVKTYGWKHMGENVWVKTYGWKHMGENVWVKTYGWVYDLVIDN